MTFQDFFAEVKETLSGADAGGIQEHLAYQFNITGEEQGTFYVEVKDGQLHIEPYEYNDRDVLFTCKADVLRRIASGETDPVKEFTLQRLKVQGDIGKALKMKEFL